MAQPFQLPKFEILPEGQKATPVADPQGTPDFGAIQRAIYIHEGGRKARTPYGYRPREDFLFGRPAWDALPEYDRIVDQEIRTEWNKYQKARQTGRFPANTPPDSDFIKWLARHGYNANYKEWDGWEAGVRRQMGQRGSQVTSSQPGGGTVELPRFNISVTPSTGSASQNAQQGPSAPRGATSKAPQAPEPKTPFRQYIKQEGVLPAIGRGLLRASEWIAANEPPALKKYLDKQVTETGEPLSVLPYIMTGQPIRFNFEKGEYEDPRTGDAVQPMRRIDVLNNLVVGGMDFSPTRAVSGVRPAARAAAAVPPAATAQAPFRPRTSATVTRAAGRAEAAVPQQQRVQLALPPGAGPSSATAMPAPRPQGPMQFAIALPEKAGLPALPSGQYPRTPQTPPPAVFSRMVMQDIANLQVPGPSPRTMVRNLDTGTLTGEILRPGERGFSELASLSLDDRLATVMADGAAFARRIEPVVDIPTPGPAQKAGYDISRWFADESGMAQLRLLEDAKAGLSKMIMSNLDSESGWISMATRASKSVARGYMAVSDEVINRSGPMGKQLVKMVHNVYNDSERYAAQPISAIVKIARESKITKEGWENIRAFREGAAINLSPQERMLHDVIVSFLDNPQLKAMAEKLGIPVPEWEPNYWPRMLDWEKLGFADTKDMFTRKIMAQNPEMSRATAESIWNKYVANRKFGRPFGNLERPRDAESVPYKIRLSPEEEIKRYILGVSKRFAEVKHFGGLNNEKAVQLLNQLPEEYLDFANKWFHLSIGDSPWIDWAQSSTVRWVSTIEAAAKLNLAFISNASQPINNLLIADLKSFRKSLQDLATAAGREGMIDFAEKAGVVHTQTLKELAALGEAVQTQIAMTRPVAQAFSTVERGNRIFTANIGKYWFENLVDGLRKGNKWAARDLERIGFSPEGIARLAAEGGNPDDEIKAARWLVEKTQFLNRPGDVPLNWNNPYLRLLFLYKRFALKQGVLMLDALKEAVKRKNPRPFIVAGAVMPAMGELIGDVRGMIHNLVIHPIDTVTDPGGTWDKVQDKKPRVAWDQWDGGNKVEFFSSLFGRWMHGMSWIGALGVAGDLMRSLAASPGADPMAAVSFISGPVGSDVVGTFIGGIGTLRDIGKATHRAGMSAEEREEAKPLEWSGARSLGRAASGALPYGQFARNLDIWKTPTAKKKMLRTMYFDALEAGDNEGANAALRALNEMGVEITAKDEKAVMTRRSKKKRK